MGTDQTDPVRAKSIPSPFDFTRVLLCRQKRSVLIRLHPSDPLLIAFLHAFAPFMSFLFRLLESLLAPGSGRIAKLQIARAPRRCLTRSASAPRYRRRCGQS